VIIISLPSKDGKQYLIKEIIYLKLNTKHEKPMAHIGG
jgi:hypothetical protein